MKPFIAEKTNSRVPTSAEAGPSNPTRAQLAALSSRQKRVHEIDDDEGAENDVQEVEVRNVRGNGKRKETHIDEEEDDDEIQEVDPPPPKTTRSRGGSRKPPSTVNGKPTATKGKAKPKIGPPRSAPKPAREPMDVDSNDAVEHEMDVDVNGTTAVANAFNAATKNNVGRASKMQSGQKNDDGMTVRLEEQLRQVRFKSVSILQTSFVVPLVIKANLEFCGL